MLQIGQLSPVFCRYLFNQSRMKNLKSAFKRARKGLHIDTNDHFRRQKFEKNPRILMFFSKFLSNLTLSPTIIIRMKLFFLLCYRISFFHIPVKLEYYGNVKKKPILQLYCFFNEKVTILFSFLHLSLRILISVISNFFIITSFLFLTFLLN